MTPEVGWAMMATASRMVPAHLEAAAVRATHQVTGTVAAVMAAPAPTAPEAMAVKSPLVAMVAGVMAAATAAQAR